MTREELLNKLDETKPDAGKVLRLETMYQTSLNSQLSRLISLSNETVFLDNNWRLLSFEEIEDAPKDLHIDFLKIGVIPLFDCGENDFVVYHMKSEEWSYFNIVDESIFKKRKSLQNLLYNN